MQSHPPRSAARVPRPQGRPTEAPAPMTARPTDIDSLLDHADAAVDRGAWDDVAALAEQMIAIDPGSTEAKGLQTLARRRSAKTDRAQDVAFGAERRTLTVMFCDLVGSTEMADRNDPEDTRAVLQWYQSLVAEVVERGGGFVAHYMGDGALVYFGWPTAIDDSALCAVRAALELLHRLDDVRHSIRTGAGAHVDLRVGVHTGLVVVGEMGAGRRRELDDVVGETPNIAARLESFASPGTVAISADTYALVRHRVDATALGPQRLKGIARAIEVFRIDGIVDHPTRFAIGRTRSPLVGRTRETARIQAAIDTAIATGHGELLGICGEAGVGKSRLLEDVLKSVDDHATVIRAQCNPHLASTAFHPIIDAVRHVGGDETGRRNLALVDRIESINIDDDDDVRESLLSGIVGRLLSTPDRTPVVLAFEDVHWADPSTMDVLRRLIEEVAHHPAVVLVTHRPDQVPDWLAELTVIDLAPLDRASFDDLVERLAADRPLPTDMRDRLFDRTGGVPLFVEELVSALLESGGQADQEAFADIPSSLNDVLVTRLDRCGHAKRTAQIASVIGRTASLGLLAQMARTPDVSSHIEVLVRAGVLERSGDNEVRFRHALVQDAAYSTMLRSTARTMHERAASAILALEPQSIERAPENLARHLHRAGRYGEALDLYRAAASQSIDRSAPHETVAHLGGALACLAENADADRPGVQRAELGLLLQMGPALIAARGYGSGDVQHTYERAAKLCEETPDSVEAFGARLGLTAFFLVNGQLDRAESLAHAMHHHAVAVGETEQPVEAAAWLGTTLFFQARYEEALPLLVHASDNGVEGERRGNRRDTGRAGIDPTILALSHLTWMHLVRGDAAEAQRRRDQMMATAERLDQAVALAHAINYASGYALIVGDDAEALRLAELERSIAAAAKLTHYVAYSHVLAGAAIRHTNPIEAAEQLSRGIRLRSEAGARVAAPFHFALLADIELTAGHFDRARIAVDTARQLALGVGELWWLPEIARLDGEVHLRHGDASTAARLFTESRSHSRTAGARFLECRADTALVQLDHHHQRHDPNRDDEE